MFLFCSILFCSAAFSFLVNHHAAQAVPELLILLQSFWSSGISGLYHHAYLYLKI